MKLPTLNTKPSKELNIFHTKEDKLTIKLLSTKPNISHTFTLTDMLTIPQLKESILNTSHKKESKKE